MISSSNNSSTRIRRGDIQGLRAIAVLLVVLYHSGVTLLSGGYIGVDVFFVISGFLITTHLLESLTSTSKIDFASFYAKRARRILPAAFVVVVATLLAAVIFVPPLLFERLFRDAIATALYAPNMLFAAEGTNYLSETFPSFFQHYWSLGIEEQFYLLWPVFLLLGFKLARRSERGLFWVVAALVVVSFGLCLILTVRQQPWAFFSLPTRAWELGAGGLVAFLLRTDALWIRRRWVGLLGWFGLTSLILLALTYDSVTPFPSFYAALPVLATALIIVGGSANSDVSPASVLSVRPLQFLGTISYSLYLVHWPLLVIPQAAVGRAYVLPLYLTLLLGAISIPIAYLLFRFVESPMLKSRHLARARPRRSLLLAGAASIVIVAIAAGSTAATSLAPLASRQPVSQTALAELPAGTPFVPSNIKPSLRSSSDDIPALYADGCHREFLSTDSSGCVFGANKDAPRVVLFGDSHATQWFPALSKLAQSGEILLETNTKSSCPAVNIRKIRDTVEYTSCEVWREGVVRRLSADPPTLTLLASWPEADLVGGNGDFVHRWQSGLEETIRELNKNQLVAVISDTPNMGDIPAVCLSAHLTSAQDCSRTTKLALDPTLKEMEESATKVGASYLDMTTYFCNAASCPAVIGTTLVYRDEHHMTASFSAELSDAMSMKIRPLLQIAGT